MLRLLVGVNSNDPARPDGQDRLEDPVGHRHRKDDGGFYIIACGPIDRLQGQLAEARAALEGRE